MASERKPWERQPDESAKAYAAFCTYRDLPAHERSIDAAYVATSGQQLRDGKRAPRRWASWSSDYSWVDRAAAHDDHLAELDRLQIEARRKEQREMEWQIAKRGLEIVRDALPHAEQFIRRRQHTTEDGTLVITLQFDVTGLAMASERFSKQGRLANDEPGEHIQLSGAALDSLLASEIAKIVDGGEAGATDADSPTAGDADEPPGGVA